MSGLLSLSLSELEITITTIPIGPFVVILSQIKELVIRILEMILRFYTDVRDPILKIDDIRSSQSPNQLHTCPCYQYSFLRPLCEERGGRQNRPSLYADVVGNPREDSI